MSGRAERNQQVTPDSLQHREEQPTRTQAKPVGSSELDELKERIEAARSLTPAIHEVHCRDCFERGRDAVLRAIEGE